MELPMNIREVIENEITKHRIAELKHISDEVTYKYKHESGNNKALIVTPAEVCTYAAVRMPATFSVVDKVIKSCMDIFHEDIKSVLDVGAGIGTASFAISNLIPGVTEFDLIEREKNMIHFGKIIADKLNLSEKFFWMNGDMNEVALDQKYDLVIASYSLNELDNESRIKVLYKMWNATNKILIIIEPGTKEGYAQIKAEREEIVDKGGYIIAPCTSNEKCPIEGDDWCHFTCRVARNKLHKQIKNVDVPYEDEKFSYIAFAKDKVIPCQARVLRHPIIENGRITLKLCEKDKIQVRTITRSQKECFKLAKKLESGSSFDINRVV